MAQKEKFVPTPPAWTWKLVDGSKIKREYLEPDIVKIRNTVRQQGPEAETLVGGIKVIPGPA